MKFATVSKTLIGVVLLMASSAFAANKANFTLNSPTTVNGTKLKAGEYKLEWDGSGPDVQLSIIQGKNVIAKVPAKVIELSDKASNDAAVIKQNEDGSTTLSGLRFQGKKAAFALGESNDGMQAGSSR